MTVNELYFDWLYNIVAKDRFHKSISYRKLLNLLNSIEFKYFVEYDENRASDGTDLREKFAYEKEMPDAVKELKGPCSVLEMMVALAIRCENQFMSDDSVGDRTGQWFWQMIVNLGLGNMVDEKFDEETAREKVEIFMDRKYAKDGGGGLFRLRHSKEDMRKIEIWYQMCEYINEVT